MWSKTVGLRTRPVSDQQNRSFLVLQVWCYVVKHGLVTLVVIIILKDTATCQILFIVSLFCAWNITTVEINSGVYLLKSYIHQVPLFTSGGLDLSLGLKNLVLFTSLTVTTKLERFFQSVKIEILTSPTATILSASRTTSAI